jgi:nicotinamide-nucleotide amidase
MRFEALCTGDELLTGLTTDSNTPYFAAKLFAQGEQLQRVQVVGDKREEIIRALQYASAEADVLIVSGGLGPTADDLTAECAAQAAGVPLVERPEVLEHLRALAAARKFALTPNNYKQALVPQGAEMVVHPMGSAPMFILKFGRCIAFFVAGVPREYRYLVDREVLPRIARMQTQEPHRIFRAARLLKTVGLPESHLDANVAPLAAAHPQVTLGFRTQAPENHLKLVASGATQAAANQALAAAEAAARTLLGEYVFGADEETLGGQVGKLLQERGATLAVAESCTGGRLAELLTAPPGASQHFTGGVVAYANEMKRRWANVPDELLGRVGAVSAEVAEQLARGIREAAGSHYGLSITGIAGPSGGSPEKPVGTVYVGLSGPAGTRYQAYSFRGDRDLIRAFSAHAAMDLLRRELLRPAP